jgi:hypothetical protein
VVHVQGPLSSPFADVVLEACLQNKARDPQVEGSRAPYMLEIVRRTGDPSVYTDKVLDAISCEANSWDSLQRFQIARLVAQEGDPHARQAMSEAFEHNLGGAMEDAFAEEFICLDGLPGLLFAISQIGIGLTKGGDRWVDDSLLSTAEDTFGPQTVRDAVRERAKTDGNVATYVEAVNANRMLRQEHRRRDPSTLSYEQIRSMIVSGKKEGYLVDWGRTADATELELAAADLLSETDPERLLSYLFIFWKRAFPLDSDHLLRLTDAPDDRIKRYALRALANLTNDEVRELALSLVTNKSTFRGYAIDLLTRNFHHGDHEMVKTWCDEESDSEILNDFDRRLGEFFNAHPNNSIERQLLTSLYDREPCSHCRCSIVARLLQLDSLPAALRAESAHDSYLKTRELVSAGSTLER